MAVQHDNQFQIGPIPVEGRAILAPMSGVTDLVFRRIARRFGASLVISEMTASADLVKGDTEAVIRAQGSGITPHVIQLVGCDPYWMGEAARRAEAAGANIIDINMGCPAKHVVGVQSGSALMRDADLAKRLMESVVKAVAVPVTVKMRLGWDASSLNAPNLARSAQEIGLQAVTVHGRTRQQFYKGQADWRAISPVVEVLDIPVIANGDIGSFDDAKACLVESKAAAVMIGRAALGQPWLVGHVASALAGAKVAELPIDVKVDAMIEHYEGLLALYGRDIGIRHARKHLAAFSNILNENVDDKGLDKNEQLALVTSESPVIVIGLLNSLVSRLGNTTLMEAAQ